MILVFGGTTEGKQVAQALDQSHVPYYYTTKTKVAFEGKGIPIFGEMTKVMLEQFCVEHKITHIINASHPFAEILHQMIAESVWDVMLIRFQRGFPIRKKANNVFYVDSFEDALTLFYANNYQSLLALSGVQTIMRLKPYWKKYPAWFRILDRDSSRAIAAQADFPEDHLLFGYPQSKANEIALFDKLAPDVIFTKESGTNGKLEEKIQAACALDIPIVIVKKPEISNRYLCVATVEELLTSIK